MRVHVLSTALGLDTADGCIKSVVEQSHEDWRQTYIAARDRPLPFPDWRVNVCGPAFPLAPILANLTAAWRELSDDDIVALLDGDDELCNPRALEIVADCHARGAWVTYGSFEWMDGSRGFARPGTMPRQEPFYATHLKTFRAGLAKRILEEDLKDASGEWFKYAGDQAIMLPILEMAGPRAVFIPDVLYRYNVENARADQTKHSPENQRRSLAEAAYVRSRLPYAQKSDLH